MEKTLSLGVVLSADDKLTPSLGKATKSIGTLDKKIKALGAGMAKMGAVSVGMGAAILAPMGAALTSYQDLAKAQGDIASLGIGESGIAKITQEAKEFSNQFAGTTAPDFVKASYDIKSGISSLSDEGVAKFTRLAALTGSATKSTTEEMTKLFALGHGIFKSTDETDFDFGNRMSAQVGLAVKAFRTHGSDLIEGISNIGAVAKSMGVTLSEELAIIGNSKGAFNSASEAATGYRAFLTGVGNAQEKLGLQFTDSAGKMLPMVDILESLKEKYGDTLSTVAVQDELKKAFGSSEAVKTITGLINKTDELRQSQIDLKNATLENVEAMARARNKGKEFEILNQQIGNAAATIGKVFAPAAYKIGEAIGSVVNKVSLWIDNNQELAETIGWVVGGAGVLLTVLGTVGIAAGGILMAMPGLIAAFGLAKIAFLGLSKVFLMNPIGLAITAIAVAAGLIYTYWDPIKTFFSELFASIKNGFNWLGSSFNKVKGIGSSIKSFFGFGGDSSPGEKANAAAKPMQISKPASSQVQQTNHIKVNVNNPNSTVDVEKAITNAMNKGGADRGLSDDDI